MTAERAGARGDTTRDLPLLVATPRRWARVAASRLDVFLSDHAVCEQQAALSALNLVAHYPDDDELTRRMGALAAEEVSHLRRVLRLLHARGLKLARRRANSFVQGLRTRLRGVQEPELKIDRLLVGAIIEARSCERFTLLQETIEASDPDVAELLRDLGPAEKRHWELFHHLAARDLDPEQLDRRWCAWLEVDRDLMGSRGVEPTVHG